MAFEKIRAFTGILSPAPKTSGEVIRQIRESRVAVWRKNKELYRTSNFRDFIELWNYRSQIIERQETLVAALKGYRFKEQIKLGPPIDRRDMRFMNRGARRIAEARAA